MEKSLCTRFRLAVAGLLLISPSFLSRAWAADSKVPANDKASGIVRVVGSGLNAKVVLTDDGGGNQQSLCRDDQAKKVGRLIGMTIAARGHWEEKDPKDKCLAVIEFEIEKGSSGRKPLVGILSKLDNAFVLDTGDGQKHALERVPSGLKELVGKKVIVDVKPLKTATGSDNWKVVSYSEYP